jgi:hypothetical protein
MAPKMSWRAPSADGFTNQLGDRKNAWRGRRTAAYSSRIAGKLFQVFSNGVFRNDAVVAELNKIVYQLSPPVTLYV